MAEISCGEVFRIGRGRADLTPRISRIYAPRQPQPGDQVASGQGAVTFTAATDWIISKSRMFAVMSVKPCSRAEAAMRQSLMKERGMPVALSFRARTSWVMIAPARFHAR